MLPNSTAETKQKVRMILSAINHLEFGGFEDLQPLMNYSFNNLESLNLTRLIELVRCDFDIHIDFCLVICIVFVDYGSLHGLIS